MFESHSSIYILHKGWSWQKARLLLNFTDFTERTAVELERNNSDFAMLNMYFVGY